MNELERLRQAISTLDGISVPAQYTEQISIPIYNVSNLLKAIFLEKIKAQETVETEPKEEIQEVESDETVEQSV